MRFFGSSYHISSLYLLAIDIGWGSEGILDKTELEVRFWYVLLINHFWWRSFIVLFQVISLEGRILSKFGLRYTIQGACHFFDLENIEHDTLNVSLLLGRSTVKAFVVVFLSVNDYFV
jgi:hypothetical protein